MKTCILIAMNIIFLLFTVSGQTATEITGWQMQDSGQVGATGGEEISTSAYTPTGWYDATVPGTVLRTLVDQGVYEDPMVGENMYAIPDLANEQRRYWYRAKFTAAFEAGQRVWVEFGGINYRATIFCNGTQVGTMYGAFKRGKFDVTDVAVSGENILAVKIQGNKNPGEYHRERLSGSCGGNGGIMSIDGPTFLASQGWDWIPTIPDRNMGIWRPVIVRVTGPVVIQNPWIRTTGVSATGATVPLQATLKNSTAAATAGTIAAQAIGPDNTSFDFSPQTVTVPANGTLDVTFADLALSNPRLWWPNGYGDQPLYTCSITFTADGGAVSDVNSFRFGVREYSFSSNTGSLIISCNGQRILTRGGNWGMDDAMKTWDVHKLRNRVRYHKEMNFNMIRDWVGQTDQKELYEFCDEYGQMVWADMWEPHQADRPGELEDVDNFIVNMEDKIYRLRNHASVAVWCARNESSPTAAVLTALNDMHTLLDGTRNVISSSGSGGVHSGGPYTYTSPSSAHNVLDGFHTELGGQCVPSYESMTAMLPTQNWPINNSWSFHDFCKLNADPDDYVVAVRTLFGQSDNLKDFCERAQIVNYDSWRAYFEALQDKRFTSASGLLLWMSNPVWPSTVWQTYDYYMEGTGAMYGSQKGSQPVHIMYYGSGNYNVSVINNTRDALSNYSATATTYNLDGSQVWTKTESVTLGADEANDNALGGGITKGTSTPYFLDLKLRDSQGNVAAKNFYWLPSSGTNISGMLSMDKATLTLTTDGAAWDRAGEENTLSFKVVNGSAVCAVACRLKLTGTGSGKRILPCHYNDNYFSLAPGDTQTVVIQFDEVDRGGEDPKLVVSGINVDETEIAINEAPVISATAAGTAAPRPSVVFANGLLLLSNLSEDSPWNVVLYDMSGRVASTRNGRASGFTETVSLPFTLRSGVYIASFRCGSTSRTSLVTVTR